MKPPRIRLALRTWVGAVGLLVAPSIASAQFISDPYDPWNFANRSSIYPTAPINSAMPNQARYGYLGGVSPYQPYAPFNPDDPFGRQAGTNGRFVPYYQAFRGLDRDFKRVYKPNANDTFFEDQEARQRAYFEALREPDPRKRAEKLKKLSEANRKAVRDSSAASVRRGGAGANAPRPAPNAGPRQPAARTNPAGAAAPGRTAQPASTPEASELGSALGLPMPLDLLRPSSPVPDVLGDDNEGPSRAVDRQLERIRARRRPADPQPNP